MDLRAQLRTQLVRVETALKEETHEGELGRAVPLFKGQVVPVDVVGGEDRLALPGSQVVLVFHALLEDLPLVRLLRALLDPVLELPVADHTRWV